MSDYNYDMIDRYVSGDMDPQEKQAFELLLQQDAGLRKEVQSYKEVHETLKRRLHPVREELEVRDTLAEMRQQYFSKPGAKVIQFARVGRIAAIAAAIILVVLIWRPWGKPDLYRQYASLQMDAVAVRGGTQDSLKQEVVRRFNNKEFAASIPLFENLLRNDTGNAHLQFYYAVALMQVDRLVESRTQLMQLHNGASVFRDQATFFMALSYLKEKNILLTKEWLNKISQDSDVYSRAQELLKELL